MIFSRDEESFQLNNDSFCLEVRNVEVRINKDYKNLLSYYKKNWLTCTEKWVKIFRKYLPLLGDHTTNRVERMFWSLKLSISGRFSSKPNTILSIIHMINFADEHISERLSFTTTRSLKIYNADPFICDLNEVASQHLNDRGCVMFDKMWKVFKTLENNLSFVDGGVLEKFKDGEKVYNATLWKCNCTFHAEHQVPCRHITFLQSNSDEVIIFDIFLFHKWYLRGTEDEETADNTTGDLEPVEPHDDIIMDVISDLEEEEDSVRTLNDREKYNMVLPKLMKIANLIAAHNTTDFYEYLDDLEKWKLSVRRGQKFLP